jgi:hypothetical protein
MTDTDITPIEGTKTHPYIATIIMDPATWSHFEATFEDRPEVKVRRVDRNQPDVWTVYVAGASEAVKDLLEEHW